MELKQRYAKYASVHSMLCTASPQIVSRLPATTEEIAAIQGIGKVKSDKIGPRLLDVIRRWQSGDRVLEEAALGQVRQLWCHFNGFSLENGTIR